MSKYFMKPYWQIREMVKDPSLKAKEIAEKTGYKLGYVYSLRRTIMAREAGKLARRLEQKAMIDGLIAEAVAKEREACARLCDIAVENFTSISLQVDDHDGIVMEHANTCSHLATAIRARGQA
jgi:hypothetical protein